MDFFLMIFAAFIFVFSKAEEKGSWNMDHPIYKIAGDTFYLRYTTKDDLNHCKFTTPDDIKLSLIPDIIPVNTTGKRPPNWTWNRYWMNNPTDCGIQINNATVNDSGLWDVLAVIDKSPFSFQDTTNVTILALEAPKRVILEPNIIDPIYMEPGSLSKAINISCTAYKSRGNVTLTWWIGDNQISRNITNYVITNNNEQDRNLLYKDVSQTFEYFPVPSHDHKKLKCIANHSMYKKDDLAKRTNIATIIMDVSAPPLPQEDIVFENHSLGNQSVEIQFHANPAPKRIFWIMHDMKKPLGIESSGGKQTSGRYISLGWKQDGNYDWTATIHVTNLSKSDADLKNRLWVENYYGNTTYAFTFTFDSEDLKVAGLSVGAIAGIVLGCLGAVCLIWLVVSQLRKKRKSKKITQEEIAETRGEMRETSRTQHQDD